MIATSILACCLNALQEKKARHSDRVAMPGLREVDRAFVLHVSREKTVCVPVAVNVEADELTVVVEAVDGGPDAVGVVDRQEVRMVQGVGQYEAVHLARAVHVHTHDLIILVDAQGGRVGRAGEVELAEGFAFQQEADHVAIGGRQEADHIAVVVDTRGGHIAPARRDDFREFAGVLV